MLISFEFESLRIGAIEFDALLKDGGRSIVGDQHYTIFYNFETIRGRG